jgi:transcription initiation factor TFIIIB Brf1 subunit/transcription initiation factor TFIIB
VLAAILSALYGLFHLLGWREHVSSVYATAGLDAGKVAMGFAYAAAYFASVLCVPVLVLAAGIFAVLRRILPARHTQE